MSNHNNHNPNASQPQQNRESREASSRDLDSRATFARPETWAPPSTLPDPIPMDGYVYRWIRTATHGDSDAMNVNRQYREGFSPVPAEEQPHIALASDAQSNFKGSIEIGGLLLCKAPKEFMAKRAKYYADMNANAQRSVDNSLMKEQDPRMPLNIERKTKVTFGSGGA